MDVLKLEDSSVESLVDYRKVSCSSQA